MGKDIRTGKVAAVEVSTGQIPGQMSVNDVPGVVPEAAPEKAYDAETGEILEEGDGQREGETERKVVDMRKQA